MILLKKLILAPLFLTVFGLLIYQLNSLFVSYEAIFSLSWDTLIQLITLASLIVLASLLFTLFSTLTQDWKVIVPVGLIAAVIPLFITTPALGVVLLSGTVVSLVLTYLTLENKLKSYLTFEPNSLLGPSIRYMTTLLVIVISLSYFLSINKLIQQDGFKIPDSLIDMSLKIAGQPQSENSQEQIDLAPQSLTGDLLKQAVKDQLQTLLKPYLGFIPASLAIILFLTLQSLTAILNLLIYPLLWITFYILEKTGFIKFTIEQRPVKKMII